MNITKEDKIKIAEDFIKCHSDNNISHWKPVSGTLEYKYLKNF